MSSGLSAGFMLDRQWHWLRGEMETTKKPALVALCRILDQTRTPYAIIGGVALQIYQKEPRTMLDIDVAVLEREMIPRSALASAGFHNSGSFEHSENWLAPDGTPVQFTDGPALVSAIGSAGEVVIDDVKLRVIRVVDLLHEKLRSGTDPAPRRSKRLQDLADAQALIESDPALAKELRTEERAQLDRLPE